MPSIPRLILKPGRERSLLRRHQWIFSGAVDRLEGEVAPGGEVVVADSRGRELAVAAWSPDSQIAGRVWSFDPAAAIDRAFFRRRIDAALRLRRALGYDDPAGGCRLVFSEGDFIPGFIADRYGEYLVVQFTSAGAEFHRAEICDTLAEATGCRGIYERSDLSVRAREGLAPRAGECRGEPLPDKLIVTEAGERFEADPRHGQKTGFYFDLRDVREAVRRLARGRRFLNAFCYTGAFAVAALAAGAESVLNLDSSEPALRTGRRNLELNGLDAARAEWRRADVFSELRRLRDAGERFDLIVLDPPKLVDSRGALARGCRAYQDLARIGFLLLNPGGILINLSCSGLMEAPLFQKITADAAVDAGCDSVRIVGRLNQSADHPVALGVPESAYLKGFISAR